MTKRLVWIWIGALVASAPLRAQAESRPTLLADHKPGSKDAALELELGWYTDSSAGTTVHLLTPTLGGRYAISNNAEITLDWPFAFADVSPAVGNGTSSFRTGNPFAALYYMQRRQDGYFRIGGGIAPPLAHVSSSTGSLGTAFLAYAGASAMHGLWNLWLYTPDYITLAIPGQLETQSGRLVLGADFAGAVLVPTSSRNSKTNVALQLAGSIGAKIDSTTLGVRLQGVWLPTSNGDNAQLALVPFVQADFSGGGFVYARFLLNLDRPFGVFGDRPGLLDKVWGLYLGAGTRF
jgi:hypothetical protein